MELKLPVGMCRLALMMIFGAGCHSLFADVGSAVSIVVPATPDAVVRTAASELRDYLSKMGVQSVSVAAEDSSVPVGRPVYVGRTAFAAAHGIDFGTFADEEWMVCDVEGSLVIGGGGRRGALYGAYHFLEDAMGVRWFSPYAEVVPRHETVAWEGLDMRGRPAMRYRDIYYVTGSDATAFLARNRMNTESAAYGGRMRYSRAATNHSLYRYLGSPDEVRALFSAHPEWFPLIDGERRLDKRANSASKTQLCLTNPDLRQHFTDCVRRHVAADRAAAAKAGIEPPMFYAIDQNDCYDGFCRCPGCAAVIEREGGTSGLMLEFANAVAAALEAEAPGATFQMMAYFSTEKPPRHARPRRNVGIRLCDSASDLTRPWSDAANSWMRGDGVYASVYTDGSKALAVVAHLAKPHVDQEVEVAFDWKALGIDRPPMRAADMMTADDPDYAWLAKRKAEKGKDIAKSPTGLGDFGTKVLGYDGRTLRLHLPYHRFALVRLDP